jgi:hypothetical protein
MSVFDEVFTYKALAHAIAGTAGGQTSMTLFFPLDHLRTHLQVKGDEKKVKFLQKTKNKVNHCKHSSTH